MPIADYVTRDIPDIITVADVARLLAVSRSTVLRLINIGELTAFRTSTRGNLRVTKAELKSWICSRTADSPGAHNAGGDHV